MKPMALLKTIIAPVDSSGTSKVFLHSTTLSSGKKTVVQPCTQSLTLPVFSDDIPDGFSETFPGVLVGHAFVDEALKQMGDSGFCALVIRADTLLSAKAGEGNNPFWLNVGSILEQMTLSLPAVWGLIDTVTLGCLLLETDLSICRDLGQRIQDNLAEIREETTSIGIAYYPAADFSPTDVVANACKALNHASLVGPGSLVVLDAVSLNISGDDLYQSGNLLEAIEEYQKALILDPNNVNVHNSLGVCYGMMEQYTAAVSEFDAALKINSDDVMVLYNRAVVCVLTGQKEEALNLVEKAVIIDDQIFEIVLLIGKLYLEAGYPKKAVSFLEKAVICQPQSGMALRTLGACLSELNNLRDAVAVYSRAVKNHPNDAESFSQLGLLYDRIGENPEIARLFCQQSVAIAPDNEMYRERLNRLAR